MTAKRPKTTSDIRKTMSYAGKIISDIIQITSDLFFAPCNPLKAKCLQVRYKTIQRLDIQYFVENIYLDKNRLPIILFVKVKSDSQTTKAGSKHISRIFAFMITFLTFSET